MSGRALIMGQLVNLDFGSPGISYLLIVTANTRAPPPCADSNVRLAVSETADKLLQLWMILDRIDADDVILGVSMHATFQGILLASTSFVPRSIQVLHEERIAFTCVAVADLLHRHVAARTYDVAHVDEIVACMDRSAKSFTTKWRTFAYLQSHPW